jgi:hypothetical protein
VPQNFQQKKTAYGNHPYVWKRWLSSRLSKIITIFINLLTPPSPQDLSLLIPQSSHKSRVQGWQKQQPSDAFSYFSVNKENNIAPAKVIDSRGL